MIDNDNAPKGACVGHPIYQGIRSIKTWDTITTAWKEAITKIETLETKMLLHN